MSHALHVTHSLNQAYFEAVKISKAHLSRVVDFLELYYVSVIHLFEDVDFVLQQLGFRTSWLK